MIGSDYAALAERIAVFLRDQFNASGGAFPGRTFYGESFAAVLWQELLPGSSGLVESALAIHRCRPGGSDLHYEFNHYALTELGRSDPAPKYLGSKVVNWFLLRSLCRLRYGEPPGQVVRSIVRVVSRHQRPSGFIEDNQYLTALLPIRRPRRPFHQSAQYHAFCTMCLAELWLHHRCTRLESLLVKAIHCLSRLVLRSGDVNFLGRGQRQAFGYGAAIAALSFAGAHVDSQFHSQAERVFSFVAAHEDSSGCLPLVLNGLEATCRDDKQGFQPSYGWYSYNNFFDYLPFLGFCLLKAAKWSCAAPGRTLSAINVPLDPRVRVFERDSYQAALALPGGFPANDLTWPYVVGRRGVLGAPLGSVSGGLEPAVTPNVPRLCIRNRTVDLRDAKHRLQESQEGISLMCETRPARLRRDFRFLRDRIVAYERLAVRDGDADVEMPLAALPNHFELTLGDGELVADSEAGCIHAVWPEEFSLRILSFSCALGPLRIPILLGRLLKAGRLEAKIVWTVGS